ncbi:FAD-dependent monooxygenase [Actinoplanes sp. NPDC049265]|uniref:FAD-dependent monooxygenase n=1 Tax=Actinoplanes sp. NPDC049265 TaxID=3363902 RepID=UPI00372021E7
MTTQRALIVGMGVGGLATALRLHEIGWETVIVERAAGRRSAGYFIALFNTGRAAAQRLGVLDAIGDRLDPTTETYDIDRSGGRRRGMGYGDIPAQPSLMLRGDVETALYEAVEPLTEIRYSTGPVAIDEHPDGVDVTLRTTAGDVHTDATEQFDLVVGADGLRSTVRRLHFGPDSDYVQPFHHIIGAAILNSAVPGFRRNDSIVLAEPGRSAWVFAFANHQPTVLFNYRTTHEDTEFGRPPIESLRRAFGPEPAGAVLENLLQQYEEADEYLFDSTHQVTMPSWHTGRVVLLGDAAWCLTLYSGMGASTALAGADLLGTSLQRNPGALTRGLREWEQKLRPFVHIHQQSGRREGLPTFVPQTPRDKLTRTITQTLAGSPVTTRAMKAFIARQGRGKFIDIAAA